jgi:hypothetical protein
MARPSRTRDLCLVCGFAEVRTDEALDGGVLFLGWCPRCGHRWTSCESSLQPGLLRARSEPGREEVAA